MTVLLGECRFFLVTLMLVHTSSKKNVPIGAFNIAFESSQNKQLQYGTKIIGTEARKKLW